MVSGSLFRRQKALGLEGRREMLGELAVSVGAGIAYLVAVRDAGGTRLEPDNHFLYRGRLVLIARQPASSCVWSL